MPKSSIFRSYCTHGILTKVVAKAHSDDDVEIFKDRVELRMPSTNESPSFPDWFPASCPPAASVDASGIVFRFVANQPIDPGDFLSHYELEIAPRANPCSRCSLSVFDEIKAARESLKYLMGRNPDRFGPHIAEGTLDASHGKLKQDGKNLSHFEWWAYEGVERHRPFRVVETLDR